MERRSTKQRQIILDAVRSRMDHPTAEMIYEQVRAEHPNLSLGTVYRNLNLLSETGEILAIRLAEKDRFDLRLDGHDHFLCRRCGKLSDIETRYDESLDHHLSKEGYVVESHQTVYNGLCAECAKKTN